MLRMCIVAAAWLASGCATTAGMSDSPADAGRAFVLTGDCECLARLVVPVLADLRFAVTDAESGACPISVVAIKPASAVSWGEYVRVRLDALDTGRTQLHVLTQRVLATNLLARGDWSGPVYRALVKAHQEAADGDCE